MSIKNEGVRQYVVNLLESYSDTQKKIALLRYELEHPAKISAEEMIDAMAFSRGDGVGRTEGTVSNKTMFIAMNYRQQADRLNREEMDDLAQRLIPLENEINRLHYYLDMLDDAQREIIQLYYFERNSLRDISQKINISIRRLRDRKDEAVENLVQMYDFVIGAK